MSTWWNPKPVRPKNSGLIFTDANKDSSYTTYKLDPVAKQRSKDGTPNDMRYKAKHLLPKEGLYINRTNKEESLSKSDGKEDRLDPDEVLKAFFGSD